METSQPEGSSGAEGGAPEVENPIDISKFEQNPCSSLTAAQLGELNLGTTGKEADETLGKTCRWRNESTGGDVRFAFFGKLGEGLSADYRAEERGDWKYFDELPPIRGFPAVARDIIEDRDIGGCPVAVGVSDKASFEVDVKLSDANVGKKDPCETAAEIAGMAIDTMKAG